MQINPNCPKIWQNACCDTIQHSVGPKKDGGIPTQEDGKILSLHFDDPSYID